MAPRETEVRTLGESSAEPAPLMERTLPSGRSLAIRTGGAGEEIEIRSRAGDLEVRIALTDAGPVVSLRAARLDVDAADVAFRCRDFDVQASGVARIASAGELKLEATEIRAQTERDIHLNGAFIRLNCTAEGEAEAQALLAKAYAAAEEAVATSPERRGGSEPLRADRCG